jgi:hypothetical protein
MFMLTGLSPRATLMLQTVFPKRVVRARSPQRDAADISDARRFETQRVLEQPLA